MDRIEPIGRHDAVPAPVEPVPRLTIAERDQRERERRERRRRRQAPPQPADPGEGHVDVRA